jgi:hypothetical protein
MPILTISVEETIYSLGAYPMLLICPFSLNVTMCEDGMTENSVIPARAGILLTRE